MKGSPLVRKLVALALEEDLALGDITAELSVSREHQSRARVIAREPLVVCGLEIVPMIIDEGRFSVEVRERSRDGEFVELESVLVELEGCTRDILAVERTVLNFLQRLSGVATNTRNFVAAAGGLVVLDTRKTMPGWRMLDKYAVTVGGGSNHRLSLGDMILVKNNHIDAHSHGVRGALARIAKEKPLYMPWEVEVRSLDELKAALEFRPTILMLDNFSDAALREALAFLHSAPHRPLIEVSGGITKERLPALKALGIDAVSAGFLTTHAPNVDISMRINTTYYAA